MHDWRLLPWVHRDSALKKREQELTFGFAQAAPSRYAKCPGMDNRPGWLFLMQHYGLPTRLLDWSESALTGLFFAVWDDKFSKIDGCVWGFNPYRFNENQIKEARVLGASNKKCQTLFREAFDKKEEFDKRIMAVFPPEIDQRVQAQLSRFTIHGEDIPLETFPSQGEILLQLVIPSEAKKLIRRQLYFMGIREANLFPDLHHLASELRYLNIPSP